jgi:group I intron endonuclease
MYGYKHTKQAIAKMKARFLNKNNHPMFGKTHSEASKLLICKTGVANPMFGKTHSEVSKHLMSIKKSLRPLGLYDKNNNIFLFPSLLSSLEGKRLEDRGGIL